MRKEIAVVGLLAGLSMRDFKLMEMMEIQSIAVSLAVIRVILRRSARVLVEAKIRKRRKFGKIIERGRRRHMQKRRRQKVKAMAKMLKVNMQKEEVKVKVRKKEDIKVKVKVRKKEDIKVKVKVKVRKKERQRTRP